MEFLKVKSLRGIQLKIPSLPVQLITEMRLNKAHKMLKSKTGSVSEIAYAVGYSNLSYFAKSFKEKFGYLPSKV